MTVLDSLLRTHQNAAAYNRDDMVPPAAIVWPDEKREWEPIPEDKTRSIWMGPRPAVDQVVSFRVVWQEKF